MDDLHLKLQLTAEDARYVREKFLSAVDEKIKFHLPKDDVFDDGVQQQQQQQQDDPMRIKVEELVKEHALKEQRELEKLAASEPETEGTEDTENADTDARLQQLRDVKHTYYNAISGLNELLSTMPETETQLEQLEQALQFIQNEQDPALSKR